MPLPELDEDELELEELLLDELLEDEDEELLVELLEDEELLDELSDPKQAESMTVVPATAINLINELADREGERFLCMYSTWLGSSEEGCVRNCGWLDALRIS